MDLDILQKVQAFFDSYPKRTYPKDQIVIFGGESPDKIFYILSGRISQYDISYRGEEVVVNIFKAPAFFPMSWAINKTPNSYFFKAEEESLVHVAPYDDVVAFIKANPDVMFDLLSRVYRGVDGVLARTVHLMSGSARSRLVYELVVEADRFGHKLSKDVYELHISEVDLSSHSGLARETISREIKHLKDKGHVEMRDGHIIVLNLTALKEYLSKIS